MNTAETRMHGKVCIVTGGSAGIGKATATALAGLGASVVILSNNQVELEAAATEIRVATGNQKVEGLAADLSLPDSIRTFVAAFHAKYGRLDVLINNAHVFFRERRTTPEGLEVIFAVIYLGPFLLTNLLLDTLRASAPSRIVNVTDDLRLVQRAGIDFDNLQGERDYDGVRAHNQAKLAMFYFSRELADRLEGSGVTVTSLYPGHVDTGLKGEFPGFVKYLYPIFKRLGVLKKPEEGAALPVYLASSPDVEGVTGQHFHAADKRAPLAGMVDKATGERLWTTSVEILHLEVGVNSG